MWNKTQLFVLRAMTIETNQLRTQKNAFDIVKWRKENGKLNEKLGKSLMSLMVDKRKLKLRRQLMMIVIDFKVLKYLLISVNNLYLNVDRFSSVFPSSINGGKFLSFPPKLLWKLSFLFIFLSKNQYFARPESNQRKLMKKLISFSRDSSEFVLSGRKFIGKWFEETKKEVF